MGKTVKRGFVVTVDGLVMKVSMCKGVGSLSVVKRYDTTDKGRDALNAIAYACYYGFNHKMKVLR